MTEVLRIITFIVAFATIWYGSGMILSTVEHIAQKLRMSGFAVSFFILGLLTSIPEATLGISSLAANKPEIFVGNLLGGIAILFFFTIPLLALKLRGLQINHGLSLKTLGGSLLYLLIPYLLLLDHTLTIFDGALLVSLYAALFIFIQQEHGFLGRPALSLTSNKSFTLKNLFNVILGVGLVLLSSNIIVEQTTHFAALLHISPFIISLLMLSIGTNIPELSLLFRSRSEGNTGVIFGDYVGSATANGLLLGLFTLIGGDVSFVSRSFWGITLLCSFGLILFYFLARSGRKISLREAFILLIVYVLFVALQIDY